MEIIHFRFFEGPNRHTLASAVEVLVDLGEHAHHPTSEHPRFVEQLVTTLPGLGEHHCALGHRGGFLERLREGTYLGHVTEHVALELLYLGGEHGVYGKTREVEERIVRIVFETETARGGRDAIESAIHVVATHWACREESWSAFIDQFTDRLAHVRLGPSTAAIWRVAAERGIPRSRLDADSLIRLGQGAMQHRVMASTTDRTSLLAIEIAQDKRMTSQLLAAQGVATTPGEVAETVEAAVKAAQRLGFPVVVKPLAGHHGQGVSMHLMSEQAVERAFAWAIAFGPSVLVEREVQGQSIRLLVVGRRMVAASERVPPAVVGDGTHTVEQLVAIMNRDPKRGRGHTRSMTRIELDGPALLFLAQHGIYPDRVLESGQKVLLRASANMSTGASARDVTKEICPELACEAVRAAMAVGLDIAGVDVITRDIGRPLAETGGAVIEVNAAPGLRMHLDPAEGSPQPVAEAIVDSLFAGRDGRIPVAAVTGTNGKTTVTRMLAHILGSDGRTVGMATTDGISIGDTTVCEGDLTGPWSARLVLNDPTVEAAVLETARGGMARGGLGFDDCDVAVVTNIGGDHLGQEGIDTIDDLVHLKSLLVDVVRPQGTAVLNADDPLVLSMAARCRGQVMLFSSREDNPVVLQHLAEGNRAVAVKRGNLVYAAPDQTYRLVGTRVLPASLGGMATMNVANAAAAAAAALALGISPRQVGKALAQFPAGGQGVNRGRLEMLSGSDLRVLIDYGHNLPAMAALGGFCRRLKTRPVVTVLGLPGDRRDQDLIDTAIQVAGFSQKVFIREDADLRGRAPGEVAELIREGLTRAGMAADTIDIELSEAEAVKQAVLTTPAGGLVLVLYERYQTARQAAQDALNIRGQDQYVEEIHASG